MAVFRVERNTGYTVMSNHHLRNKELSLKAKGLLSQMLSLPEDWDYTLAGLSHINREKIDAIREAVKELEKAGYIVRSRERDEKGRLRGADYVIYEQPQPREPEAATSGGQPPILDLPTLENPTLDNPTLEKPTQEKPTLENPTQLNKDIQKTDLPKKEKINTDLSSTDSIPIHSLNPFPYDFAIYKAIRAKKGAASKAKAKQAELKKYIFIIDEINRGEISKIFGELFFAIDPGYRGKAGEISTQYANLHADPDEKFYIPENVYIIGTMNDIDRSVDSFDFAMRRRFRFVELRADERLEMLALLEDEDLEAEAIRRMAALNNEIANVEDLNENYQIGASYFLKLKTLTFDQLWTDYLQPLLQEYVQGMYDEEGLMSRFAKAYGYQKPSVGDVNETTQNQG